MLPFLTYTEPRIAAEPGCGSGTACSIGKGESQGVEPAWCRVPMAHDQRRRGLGRLPGRHGAVPRQRRHCLRRRPLREGSRTHVDFLGRDGGRACSSKRRGCGRTSASTGTMVRSRSTGSPVRTSTRTVVNDNVYTNLMAHANLRAAVGAVRRLEQDRPGGTTWLWVSELGLSPNEVQASGRVADHMYVPYDTLRRAPTGFVVSGPRGVGSRCGAGRHVPAAPALSPTRHLSPPGAQTGRCRARDVPARQRVHARAETAQLRVLRSAPPPAIRRLRRPYKASSPQKSATAI